MTEPLLKLYGFFRSGTSRRVRIALNLKGLRYEQVAIDLRKEDGRQPVAPHPWPLRALHHVHRRGAGHCLDPRAGLMAAGWASRAPALLRRME
jgi:Glutathione S-transferase, N-terminal domain